MSDFIKYQHVEKFGTAEVEGIEVGTVHVFPKLDGTNASVWRDSEGNLCAGSRTRELSAEEDNAGFHAHVRADQRYSNFLAVYHNLVLYGEWLVPHTLKTYREDAWRKFYVFDVYDRRRERFIPFEDYEGALKQFGIDYLSPLQAITNGTLEMFQHAVQNNRVLIKDGDGVGEGVVLKNYDFTNKYGRVTWAKIVTNEFKESHIKEMGHPAVEGHPVEADIAAHFVDINLVNKVVAKLELECDGWHSKLIPRLLSTVYYDLIREEMWEILKKFKNPTINFKMLTHHVNQRIKSIRPDIF